MWKLKPMLALAALLMLPSCMGAALADMALGGSTPATIERPGAAIAAVEDRVIVRGAQALTLAALTYESIAIVIGVGVDTGLIRGELAGTIQTYNRQAVDALERGHAAVNDVDRARYAASAMRAISLIDALPVIRQIRAALRARNSEISPPEGAEAQPAAFVPVT